MKHAELQFVDTHCHIHDAEFSDKFKSKSPDDMISDAQSVGVGQLICVGTDVKSSRQAVEFCQTRDECYASLALHPHEATDMTHEEMGASIKEIKSFTQQPKVVAIGECGLDYYYHSEPVIREKQKELLKMHFELAIKSDLPLIFHVREAFSDFFDIFDHFNNYLTSGMQLRGVVHSFSATRIELAGVLERGLYVGLNGIMTFTKDQNQLEAAKAVPLGSLVIETDAPFLTPAPFRGKMCEPKHVVRVAEFLSELRGERLEEFSKTTTTNARKLFEI